MLRTGFIHNQNFSARVLAVFILFTGSASYSAEPFFEQTDVFISGTEGYHTFRIPSVVVSNRGTVMVFSESHTLHIFDSGDIDVTLKRSFDGGRTWEPLQVVWSEGQNACGGPTAVVDRDTGRIWLHMRWNHGADWIPELRMGIGRDRMRPFVCYSDDEGATWSKPRELEDIGHPKWWKYGPGPGVGIQLQTGQYKGRLVIPCFMSGFGEDVGHHGFRYLHKVQGPDCFGSYIVFSDDHGRTWERSGDVLWPWMNECQVVELADGRLMLNMRNYDKRCQCRGVAVSGDGGDTWSEFWHDPALITPTCQASILRYTWEGVHDRNRILFSNPADTKGRQNMTVKMSYDEGETWPIARVIEPGQSQYSCLTVLPDLIIGLIYEAKPYKYLRFARFNLEWLSEGQDRIGSGK